MNKIFIPKVTLSSPCLWALFHPTHPLFQWYPQSKDMLLNLSMKCWNSALNAGGPRLVIVVVRLAEVKIYVAAVEVLSKRGTPDETQFTTKIDGFLSFIPHWMLIYFFAGFFWMSPCVWPNSGFWCCVFLTLRLTLLFKLFQIRWNMKEILFQLM